MKSRGFIYVLANSAMPGLLKVGKTHRTTAERAEELSSSTGVPTPFIVIYERQFEDCDSAEAYVHTVLAQKGLKESDNREFFRASPKDVIDAIIKAPDFIEQIETSNDDDTDYEMELDRISSIENIEDEIARLVELNEQNPFAKEFATSLPWQEVWLKAQAAYSGQYDYFQDYQEAIKFFLQAAKLGCPMAYRKVGEMYNKGEGVEKDKHRALDFFKKGIQLNDNCCYLSMAELFLEGRQFDNYTKAIRKFLQTYDNSHPEVLKAEPSSIENVARHLAKSIHLYESLPQQVIPELFPYKEEILCELSRWYTFFHEKRLQEAVDAHLRAIQWVENNV